MTSTTKPQFAAGRSSPPTSPRSTASTAPAGIQPVSPAGAKLRNAITKAKEPVKWSVFGGVLTLLVGLSIVEGVRTELTAQCLAHFYVPHVERSGVITITDRGWRGECENFSSYRSELKRYAPADEADLIAANAKYAPDGEHWKQFEKGGAQ
jgi:hypothetical protein